MGLAVDALQTWCNLQTATLNADPGWAVGQESSQLNLQVGATITTSNSVELKTQADLAMKAPSALAVLGLAAAASARWHEAEGSTIQYTTVPGYFLQDDAATNPSGFDYAAWNFGLLNRTYPTDGYGGGGGGGGHQGQQGHGAASTQWQRFKRWVDYLNSNCRNDGRTRYKVLIMGRHGQGWHNAAETFYGTPAWNCYWAELDGNGTATWADPLLTPQGAAEASRANAYFASRLRDHGMPAFDSYYSSPLKRCIQTADGTFSSLDLPRNKPFRPTIKELFREGISIHTCDRRSTRREIRDFSPASFRFEDGFAEHDELWEGAQSKGETDAHQRARSKTVLDDVFAHDDGTWISVTSHSGEIRALLAVLGHREFSLGTGQIIPVLVRAEAVRGGAPAPPTTSAPGFTYEATCTAPPVTSIAGQGCVCSTTGGVPALASATPTPSLRQL
ncbi:phosphoglycerate mutase [Purpureocillium lavendulum]|uniref:Phosphoglycerate mutase n=1 Tax=Purpureocillium lavendulum TaxID=1247861 RepID=A0AB34FE13_9HYPO|nr:phosphoglycerate mutase [Purpureocillium lavendulum]